MRVLLASFWAHPAPGGVTTYLDIVSRGLKAEGHEVDVLAHTPDRRGLHLLHQGRAYTVPRAPYRRLVLAALRGEYRRALRRWPRWIRRKELDRYVFEVAASRFPLAGYDVIHTQDIISSRALARIRPPGVAHVATLHGSLAIEDLRLGRVRSMRSRLWRYRAAEERAGSTAAHVTMVPCAWLREQYVRWMGGHPDRLRVVHYGLDDQFLRRTQAPLSAPVPGAGSGRTLLLCPARLAPCKGLPYLLEALALLKRRGRHVTCWLAGEGKLRGRLDQLRQRLGVADRTHLLGHRADLPALLRHADIIVLPSLHDTLPFAVLESQYAGKATVASSVGGIPEMIEDGVTGLLVPPGDATALAAGLERLIDDSGLRRRLAANGQQHARRHLTHQIMLRQVLAAYDEAWAAAARERGRA